MRIFPTSLAALLIAAGFKTIVLINFALAKVPDTAAVAKQSESAEPLKNSWTSKPPPQSFCKPESVSSAIDTKILLALRQRHARLDAKSAELDRKQAMVTAAEHALAKQLAALRLVQSNLTKVQMNQNQKKERQWHALAKTYEAMPARDAGHIFDALSGKLIVGLLRQMDSRHGAAILAAMKTSNARLVTDELAGMTPAPVLGGSNSSLSLSGIAPQ